MIADMHAENDNLDQRVVKWLPARRNKTNGLTKVVLDMIATNFLGVLHKGIKTIMDAGSKM